MCSKRNSDDELILFGKNRGNAVLKNIDYFLTKYSVDILIRIHLNEFKFINFKNRYLVHFNLGGCSDHKIGQKGVCVSIYQKGSFKNSVEVKPVVYDNPCFKVKLIDFRDRVSYADIDKLFFKYSMDHIKSVKDLKKIILERYSYLLNKNFSQKDLFAQGVAINVLEFY